MKKVNNRQQKHKQSLIPNNLVPNCLQKLSRDDKERVLKSLFKPISTYLFSDGKSVKDEHEDEDNYAPSLIIGLLLVIPVVLLVIVTVFVKLYQSGECIKISHNIVFTFFQNAAFWGLLH